MIILITDACPQNPAHGLQISFLQRPEDSAEAELVVLTFFFGGVGGERRRGCSKLAAKRDSVEDPLMVDVSSGDRISAAADDDDDNDDTCYWYC